MLLTERGVASTACIQLLEYCGLVSGAPKPRGPIISYITHPDHYLSCASGGYGVHTASAAAPGTTAGTRDGPPASCSSELTEDASSHSSSPVPASQPASQPPCKLRSAAPSADTRAGQADLQHRGSQGRRVHTCRSQQRLHLACGLRGGFASAGASFLGALVEVEQADR
jgi:hypothetical protein